MSNSPKNTVNTNNSFEQVKSNDGTVASNSVNRTEKRPRTEEVNVEIKKMKIETPMLEQKVSMPSAANTAPPKFMSAATMLMPVPEITDEELLELTLEFERKHGI